MRCPTCHHPLIVMERFQIELDYCLSCQGLWFDQEELELLTEALEHELQFPDLIPLTSSLKLKRKSCPRCQGKMDPMKFYSDPPSPEHQAIMIDCCPKNHGLWFDHGELQQVLQAHTTIDETTLTGFLGKMLLSHHH